MESPRKNNDCYFYYYSTCMKGDTCTFRHEPTALGCETVCSFWKEGKCLNVHCSFRHMELRKNRKAIPCYWEAQPGGCLKPHCPFFHKSSKDTSSDSLSSDLQTSDINKSLGQSSSQSSDCDRMVVHQFNESNYGNPVDPLVVNFEEESDNESAPTISPTKSNQTRVVKVKTLEEIRLEKIQAESAAYYFYPGAEVSSKEEPMELESADDLRTRIMKRLNIKPNEINPKPMEEASSFEILSLDEIRKRKKRHFDAVEEEDTIIKKTTSTKKQKINVSDLNEVKIKTLAEIRAERQAGDALKRKIGDCETPTTCSEVSSTSNLDLPENLNQQSSLEEPKPAKRQRRKVSSSTDQVIASKPKLLLKRPTPQLIESTLDEKQVVVLDKSCEEDVKGDGEISLSVTQDESKPQLGESEQENSKLDDILLLDDEDIEETSINLKAEEDIFKDIDNLLND